MVVDSVVVASVRDVVVAGLDSVVVTSVVDAVVAGSDSVVVASVTVVVVVVVVAVDHRHYKGICLGVGRCDKLVSDFEQGRFHSSGILLELLRKKVPAVYQERSIRIYIF